MGVQQAVAVAFLASLLAGSLAPTADAPTWSVLMAAADGPAANVLTSHQAVGLPPTIQDGIGPGSALQMGVDGIQYVCSASFLLRDPLTATYYLSTAGHCLVRDVEDPAPVTGKDTPEMAKNRIDICVAGCINNGLGLGTYISLAPHGRYHPVAYAESGGLGQDFGIIELPADVHDLLRPELPQWGGPTGIGDGATGDLVAHYGHGALLVPGVAAVVTRTPADQGRLAVHAGSISGEGSFSAFGHVTGGDSGSAASLAVADPTGLARGTEALGVLTHSIVYIGVPLMSGTLLSHGLEMVNERIGLQLDLVLEGDPLTALPQGPPPLPPADIAIVQPVPGATVRAVNGAVAVKGTLNLTADGEGSHIEVAIDDPAYGFDSRLPVSGDEAWTATWYPGSTASGLHTLRARVVAEDGEVLDETNQTVRLEPANGPGASASTSHSSTRTSTAGHATTGPRSSAPASTAAASSATDNGGDSAVSVTVPAAPALLALAAVLCALALGRRRRDGAA